MIEFIEKNRIISLIVFVVVVVVLIIGTQASLSQQTFDAQGIKEQVNSLDSFANESSLLIEQYTQDKVSENYFIIHTQHINEKVLSFYEHINSDHIPDDQRSKVQELEKIVFNLSMSLKAIEDHVDDKDTLHAEQQVIKDVAQQLKNLTGDSQ